MACAFGAVSAFAGTSQTADLPKVWMSTIWREPAEDTIRVCAEQGVEAVEVPTWNKDICARILPLLRKYRVKGFTNGGEDTSERVPDNANAGSFERAVFVGGAYRGKAIDRTLFSFEPKAYDIIVEPPVYSARQGYTTRKKGPDGKTVVVKSGHYFGSCVPVGDAEIVVPEKPTGGSRPC